MRVSAQRDTSGFLVRLFSAKWSEFAYMHFGMSGLAAEIEFPSDWHDHKLAWIRLGLGFARVGLAFPWPWVVPDDYQCSGPTYGFTFFGRSLHLHWGKDHGESNDPHAVIDLPWAWEHVRRDYLWPDGRLHHTEDRGPGKWESAPDEIKEKHSYRYVLRSGDIQERTATIYGEEREWRWKWLQWLPWPRRIQRTIDIEFSDEVGESTGSWKGGCTACGWDWKRGEEMVEALRRMERDRRF